MMRHYKKHKWMAFEKNPDFQEFSNRYSFASDFWSLKSFYNEGKITNPASNEFIAYSELFFENVFIPIIEEFFYPKHERFKQFSKVIADAIITGQFEELVYKNQNQFETAIEDEVQRRLAIEKKNLKQHLLDELVEIDEAEIPDAGFYHEYEKKKEELKRKEDEMYYEKKEMEIASLKMDIERKSMDFQKQLVELIKATNLQELNKKELEIAQQILDAKTRDLENVQKMNDLENKIWLLHRHIKKQEIQNTLDGLTAFRRFLSTIKERDIQEIEMQVIKGQKKVDQYIKKQVDEISELEGERNRLRSDIKYYRAR